ncbi:hypothetical protein MY10362_004783 [Beauveria mimosiformis]
MSQPMQQVTCQQPASLVEAEERAGYVSWGIRDEVYRLIDVGVTPQDLPGEKKELLQDEVRTETGATSFFLDVSHAGMLVVLSFDEAELAQAVIRALGKRGVWVITKKLNGGEVGFGMIG